MSAIEDNSQTLASLRARRGKPRVAKHLADPPPTSNSIFQTELFRTPVEDDPLGVLSENVPFAPRRSSKPTNEDSFDQSAAIVAASAERHIWSVRALVTDIRQHVETTYIDIWVEGEISNCRSAPSGHIYFTLKDGDAQLPVVLFRRQASLLRFRLNDGLAVLVRGRISVYESRGQLQLIAETMEPRGAGALQLAFEQLKVRLLAEGLFDASRKRQLPAYPKCIGIVTSPTGAVIQDIVTVIRRRHARLNLLIYPATMQGVANPATVAAGIRWFNAHPSLVDVIVLARGGGSMEDLAGFNDEALARVIAVSELPIVSAVGHETDFTIADFVADLRAPTPSAAAELVTGAQHKIEERVAALAARVQRAGRYHLMKARHRYAQLSSEAVLTRLHDGVNRREQRLDELRLRLDAAARRRLRAPSQRFASVSERLHRQDIAVRIAMTQRRLQGVAQRLQDTTNQIIVGRRARLNHASARLGALSPLAVLSRGYALVYDASGALLRSATDTAVGHTVRARLANGILEAEVTATQIEETDVTETRNS